MVLDRNKLQELNRYMLGLGAPVERDNVGYNKPDFGLMEGLARFIPALDDKMAYAVAERLSHYKTTQLSDMKEDLEETVNYYRELTKMDKPVNYRNICDSYEASDFVPYEAHLFMETESSAILTFDSKLFLQNVNIPYWAEIHWVDNNYSKLEVPKTRLEDFLERIKDYGKYGYAPDADVQALVEKIKNNRELLDKSRDNNMKLVGKTEDNSTYYVRFTSFADIKEFMEKENIISPGCLKWKKIKENIVLAVNRDEMFYLYDEVKKLGFYNAQLEEKSKEVKLLSDDERMAKANTELLKGNVSGNHLVDIGKFTLPFTPYDFQMEDATRIVENKSMLIGHDMGCGKTFIATLVGTSLDMPKLVVVPESLRLNWRKEIKNVTPDASIRVLYSKDKFDIEKDNMPDWTIVGYKTVTKYAEQLKALGYQCVFVDEAHNCKAVNNRGEAASQRAKAVLDLCESASYVYPMTGTPIPTRNKDLFNILKMLKMERAGEVDLTGKWGFYKYATRYCDAHNNGFGWECEGNSNSAELNMVLKPYMVRRLKSDVLPNLTKQRLFIPTETTSREYKDIEKRLHHMQDGDTYMGLAMTGRNVLSKEKVKPAIDLAESILEEGKSVVLVSNFNETLDTIMERFGDDCCSIRGGMSDVQKQKAIDDFQSGKKHVCALNIIAGGVGVTLTKAHDMVIVDYDWTPANMSQVEDRICRAGQTEGCNIHYIYCENSLLDITFVDMITSKSSNIDRVVDGTENTMDLKEGVSFMKKLQEAVEKDKMGQFAETMVEPISKKHTITPAEDRGYIIDDIFLSNEDILSCLDYKKTTTIIKKIEELMATKESRADLVASIEDPFADVDLGEPAEEQSDYDEER